MRGVIAAEAANNSREGGALIPTLAFGLPGSPSMALLLGAFLAHGITPGPKLLTTQLDITFTLVWCAGARQRGGRGICFLFAGQLARLAMVRWSILVPIVFAICFVGAFQGSRSYGDLVTLIGFGIVGWFMKRYGWARAPLILGFILGKLIEKYLFISVGRYQFEWLERPGVIAIFLVTAMVLLWPLGVALDRQWRPAPAAIRTDGAVAAATRHWGFRSTTSSAGASGRSPRSASRRRSGAPPDGAVGAADAADGRRQRPHRHRLRRRHGARGEAAGPAGCARRTSHQSGGAAAELGATTVYGRFGAEPAVAVGFLIGDG